MSTTPGTWNFACDSYGKVQHSKMACVYTNVSSANGDRLVNIASRITNWSDAKLIAAAPDLLSALRDLFELVESWHTPLYIEPKMKAAKAALLLAETGQREDS